MHLNLGQPQDRVGPDICRGIQGSHKTECVQTSAEGYIKGQDIHSAECVQTLVCNPTDITKSVAVCGSANECTDEDLSDGDSD